MKAFLCLFSCDQLFHRLFQHAERSETLPSHYTHSFAVAANLAPASLFDVITYGEVRFRAFCLTDGDRAEEYYVWKKEKLYQIGYKVY